MFNKWQRYDPSYVMRLMNAKFRRREAIALYREVLRVCKLFTWRDPESGLPWGDILRASARAEFDSSKDEKDPEILARALVNARMALDDLRDKYRERSEQLEQQEKMRPSSVSREDKVASPSFIVPGRDGRHQHGKQATDTTAGSRIIIPGGQTKKE